MTPRVEWKTFDQLEASLRALQQLYTDSHDSRSELRKAVIRAKDRARFAARNPKVAPEKRAEKEEMVRWMLVWLENPLIFTDWIVLRRARLQDPAIL